MVEGEFDEVIVDLFLQTVDVVDFFLFSFLFFLLLIDFLINIRSDFADIIFMLP